MHKLIDSFMKKRFSLTCLLVVASLSTTSCHERQSNLHDSNMQINEIYQNLNLVHFSPDYPGHPKAFNHCIKTPDEGCYSVIERVKEAVSTLEAMDKETALKNTIGTIEKYCKRTENQNTQNSPICEGALTSIYLFDSVEDDALLLSNFKAMSSEQNSRIFDGNQEWFYNRKDITPWINHIKNVLEGNTLELQLWRFNQIDVKPFGLMYFESPIPSGDNLTY